MFLVLSSVAGDRFILIEQLASGSSVVFSAVDELKCKQVVVKFAHTNIRGSMQLWKENFILANYLTNCLGVPQIEWYHHYRETASISIFILVESPIGLTLDTFFTKHNHSPPILHQLAREVLDILKVIHKCGVIHRDIKPENIIVCPHSQKPCIIDFGISLESSPFCAHADTGGFEGTWEFASDNQRAGKFPTPEDDFISLCYTFYSLECKGHCNPRPSFASIQKCSDVVKTLCSLWYT